MVTQAKESDALKALSDLRAHCNREIKRLNGGGMKMRDFDTTNDWLKRLDVVWRAMDAKASRPTQPASGAEEREVSGDEMRDDAMTATARKNLRTFIKGASFKCQNDREAALSCVDVVDDRLDGLNDLVTLLRCAKVDGGALRGAVTAIMARCEAMEDESYAALATGLDAHATGFHRGQKSTAKSLRRELHDLIRSAPAASDGIAAQMRRTLEFIRDTDASANFLREAAGTTLAALAQPGRE